MLEFDYTKGQADWFNVSSALDGREHGCQLGAELRVLRAAPGVAKATQRDAGRRYTARCSLRGPGSLPGADFAEIKNQGGVITTSALMSPVKHLVKGPQGGIGKSGVIRNGKAGSRGSECAITTDNICSTKRRGQFRVKESRGEEEINTKGGPGGKRDTPGSISKYFQSGMEETSKTPLASTESLLAPEGPTILEQGTPLQWEAQMNQLTAVGGAR
ncbi:hypothetical protein NDU88_007745 [Pleurodeles waltl]|uniref:Uncharacterized protein n=1 Tax=Pleurodeles waltl TaxID=8319 RepID=A0AAV7NX66_PLEWA|nr:hypothetical protein NDU88_007745 [Pleurodeles waltl]